MVDATESWDLPQALRTGRVLQEAGITWLEDPVHHQDLAGLAQLASTLEVPVAGGEHLYQLEQFKALCESRAVDIAILDLARVGGITPWRKIAALAQAYRVPVCGHVVPEVHVHLLAAVPNGYMVEYMPRSGAMLQTMPALQDGNLVAPQAPGLGLVLDEGAVQRFRVA
jgi:L-talarate/galactarate dehydratase